MGLVPRAGLDPPYRTAGSIVAAPFRRWERSGLILGRGWILSGFRLVNTGDDLIKRLSGEERVSLRCVIAVAGRELIEKPDRVNGPELSAQDLDGPLKKPRRVACFLRS